MALVRLELFFFDKEWEPEPKYIKFEWFDFSRMLFTLVHVMADAELIDDDWKGDDDVEWVNYMRMIADYDEAGIPMFGFSALPTGFRSNVGHYIILGTSVTGGLPASSHRRVPCTGTCSVISNMWTGTSIVKCLGSVFFAAGKLTIRLFDNYNFFKVTASS